MAAIGGTTRDNIAEVVAGGTDSVSVMNPVVGADDPGETACGIVLDLEVNSE